MNRLIALAAFFAIFFGFSQTKEIESISIQLALHKQDSSKVNTSLDLIKALYKAQDYQKALFYLSETEQLSTTINYNKGIAETNYYKALIYAKNNDYYNAIDHFNKSKRLFSKLNDNIGVAKASNSIGLIEIKRGNYTSGLANALSAIKIFENHSLYEELSVAYNSLAEAYLKINQTNKALEFNTKALHIRERVGDSDGIKISTKNIAKLYSERKEHRKSIDSYQSILTMLNPETDQSLKGEILPRIGDEYIKSKDYDKAAEYLVESIKYNRKTQNNEGLLLALNSTGYLNLEKKNIGLAERQILEAYRLAIKVGNEEELLKNYKLLMALDSMKGKFENAYRWQREYFTLKHHLYIKNQPKLPTYIDAVEELIDHDSNTDITSESKPPVNNADQVKTLKILSYGLVAAFLTVLTFLLLIYLKRKSAIAYTQELEKKNAQIQLQNDAIMKQKDHLEEINSVKDRLFSIVSHDLKDSVSSIKGFLDLLKEDSISKKEFDALLPELSENANNASLLIFNLLNWSKTQMQNLKPNPELFNIQEVFYDKINLVEQKIAQKRIVVIDESKRDFIYADKSMVEIIIQNLLTNAVKFSRMGDTITISNKECDGNSLICVEDTGIGISKENFTKLFQHNNFTTIGTQNEKGTGLGLTICRELVELNNGRIWVESTENVGTKFYVEFPNKKTEE